MGANFFQTGTGQGSGGGPPPIGCLTFNSCVRNDPNFIVGRRDPSGGRMTHRHPPLMTPVCRVLARDVS